MRILPLLHQRQTYSRLFAESKRKKLIYRFVISFMVNLLHMYGVWLWLVLCICIHMHALSKQHSYLAITNPLPSTFSHIFCDFNKLKEREKKSQSEARSRVKCKHFNLRMGLLTQLNSHWAWKLNEKKNAEIIFVWYFCCHDAKLWCGYET